MNEWFLKYPSGKHITKCTFLNIGYVNFIKMVIVMWLLSNMLEGCDIIVGNVGKVLFMYSPLINLYNCKYKMP